MKTRTHRKRLKKLAYHIAKSLFTNGNGEVAERLVCEHVTKPIANNSGWAMKPMANYIYKLLAASVKRSLLKKSK